MNIELTKPPQFSKPSLFDILREVRAPFEFASVALHVHALRQAPRGNGRAVLLVPGYLQMITPCAHSVPTLSILIMMSITPS